MVACRRGLTAERALADARSRVRALRGRTQAELARRLRLMAAFARSPDAPLGVEDLTALRRHAEAALGLCAGPRESDLGQALRLLSGQCDALAHRPDGHRRAVLVPAFDALALLRAGTASPDQRQALLQGLRECLAHFLKARGDPEP